MGAVGGLSHHTTAAALPLSSRDPSVLTVLHSLVRPALCHLQGFLLFLHHRHSPGEVLNTSHLCCSTPSTRRRFRSAALLSQSVRAGRHAMISAGPLSPYGLPRSLVQTGPVDSPGVVLSLLSAVTILNGVDRREPRADLPIRLIVA